MAISTTIKPLNKGYSQVDTTTKDGYTRHYCVPKKNTKIFASSIKEQNKTMNIYTNIVFFSSIVAGILAAYPLTKNMNSRLSQFLVQTAAAIGLTTITSLGFNKYAESEHNDLLKRFGAKEIFYKA